MNFHFVETFLGYSSIILFGTLLVVAMFVISSLNIEHFHFKIEITGTYNLLIKANHANIFKVLLSSSLI